MCCLLVGVTGPPGLQPRLQSTPEAWWLPLCGWKAGKVHGRQLLGSQGDLVTKGQMVSEATRGYRERPSHSEVWSGGLHARLQGAGEGQASSVPWQGPPALTFPAFLTGSWPGEL